MSYDIDRDETYEDPDPNDYDTLDQYYDARADWRFEKQMDSLSDKLLAKQAPAPSTDKIWGAWYRQAGDEDRALYDQYRHLENEYNEWMDKAEEQRALGDISEAVSMENQARFALQESAELRPKLKKMVDEFNTKMDETGFEKGLERYATLDDPEREEFDRAYPGHYEEAAMQHARQTTTGRWSQRNSKGRQVFILHPNKSTQEMIKDAREIAVHEPALQDLPDSKIGLRAIEMGLLPGAVLYDPVEERARRTDPRLFQDEHGIWRQREDVPEVEQAAYTREINQLSGMSYEEYKARRAQDEQKKKEKSRLPKFNPSIFGF